MLHWKDWHQLWVLASTSNNKNESQWGCHCWGSGKNYSACILSSIPTLSHLFPLSIRSDSIIQLQGETRLRLADDKYLKEETKPTSIKNQETKTTTFRLDVQTTTLQYLETTRRFGKSKWNRTSCSIIGILTLRQWTELHCLTYLCLFVFFKLWTCWGLCPVLI